MQVMKHPGLSALSLIMSLLVVGLVAFLVIGYMSGKGGGDSAAVSPIERAQSVECLAQVKKIEIQVQMYSVQNGRYPETLEMVEGISERDLHCPVTQNAYDYDPQSGRVSCPDHIR
ncbi:MAG: type II secretion system protein GspG [candidate division WOR-3 bacterium]|nr:MAG: type II secretion system protein GspG [candidate division WOR-3 bacterium]